MSFTYKKTKVDADCYFIELAYVDGKHTVVFIPEDEDEILQINPDAINGKFDTNPSNGSLSLSWSEAGICIEVGKYGDGYGGNLIFTLSDSPDVVISLRNALKEWKNDRNRRDEPTSD